jgi:class 3 adenylate cyclase
VEETRLKSLRRPDEEIHFPGVTEDLVEIGGMTVSRTVQAAGWRWSTDTRPLVGGEWCEARHVGVVVSGRWAALLRDGTTFEAGPDDVYDLPPGHDCWTLGDVETVMIEWLGMRTFAGPLGRLGDRLLATLLFFDIVASTETVVRLGDAAWQVLLDTFRHTARAEIERFGGREVDATGDELFAVFGAPAGALQCAAAVRSAAGLLGISVRAGVHVGEVAVAGASLRGVAVHEGARIMGMARADEILVSETTLALVHGAGLRFDDRGEHELKGLGTRRLHAYLGSTSASD